MKCPPFFTMDLYHNRPSFRSVNTLLCIVIGRHHLITISSDPNQLSSAVNFITGKIDVFTILIIRSHIGLELSTCICHVITDDDLACNFSLLGVLLGVVLNPIQYSNRSLLWCRNGYFRTSTSNPLQSDEHSHGTKDACPIWRHRIE